MARSPDERPRTKRFSKSGHTSHQPRTAPPDETRRFETAPGHEPPTVYGPPPHYSPPHYAAPTTPPTAPPPPRVAPPPPGHYTPDHPQARYAQDGQPAGDGFAEPSYHKGEAPPASPAVAITKAAITKTNRAARVVTRKVISASKADGADRSGLTALIWNQVLSYGTDAMITVALAGTVFFGASTNAQRGNVLLYLLVTMAPFAVVAPIIGPALDRLQHGRRWTMAGTAIGRAVLAVIMAGHPTSLVVLYPCALGSLVLSKAYAVIRAAAAPRLVPPGMTLTEANARLSIFGLGSTLVLGGLVGAVISVTGSYSLGLYLTAVGFTVCAVFAFKLPPNIDSAVSASRHPEEPVRPRTQQRVPPLHRIRAWSRRGFDDRLVIALQGESALRLLSGLLTIYLAFYVEGTTHGLTAALDLGAVVGAAGFGNFTGTAIGTKLRMAKPELVIVISVVITAVVCVLVAITFTMVFAVIGMYISAIANALSKIALDALIQRDVLETLRSSAFARSETFLQLAWVVGAGIGVLLPSTKANGGPIGFWVAAVILGVTGVVLVLRNRVVQQHAPAPAPVTAAEVAAAPASQPPSQPDMRKTRPY